VHQEDGWATFWHVSLSPCHGNKASWGKKSSGQPSKRHEEVKKALYPNKTPPGFEERESNTPTPFEQRYAKYENFDPSHPFAPYVGQVFDALPPE
jgi:hypothetical protein